MISSTSSQAMLNHHQQLGLFEDEDQDQMSTQMGMGFYSFPPNHTLTLPPLASSSSSSSCHHSLKTFTILPPTDHLHETLLLSPSSASTPPIPKQQHQDLIVSSHPQLQRSSANLWTWELNMNERLGCSTVKTSGDVGDNNKVGVSVSAMKMKKMKARRKVREPRFCFKTRSDVDVLDDGYKWRKYGQKVVKNTLHPRSYYRCTQGSCRVKKRVERLAEDPRMVITTYEGRHAHSPSHDLEGSQSPSHLTNFFW